MLTPVILRVGRINL